MRHFIVNNTDRLCLRQKLVGTKASNLSRLSGEGYPVPPFFVISTDVFNRYFKLFSRSKKVFKNSYQTTNYKKAKSFFESQKFGGREMPAKFWKALEKEFTLLQTSTPESKPLIVVRSSSPIEDRAMYSFAGQFTTILNVKDIHTAWEAIKQCWLSLWRENVQSYLLHSHIKHGEISMAVIVQQMVQVKVSGVLFTQDPVSNDDSTMVAEAAYDSPDGVVGGKSEPIRIRIDKETLKIVWIQPEVNNSNQKKLKDDYRFRQFKQFIDENNLRKLAQTGKDLESFFNNAQDIEWAVDHGNDLSLLQSRPLTTGIINDRQRMDKHGDWWTDYFFVERFVDPVTPLGWSIIGKWIEKRALREPLFYLGFDELCRRAEITRLFDFHPYTRIEVFQSLYSVIPDFAISEDKKRAFLTDSQRSCWFKQLIRSLPYLCTRLLFKDINWIPTLHLRAWQRFLSRYLNQLKRNQPSLVIMDLSSLRKWFLHIESLTDELLSYHRWSITFADLFFHLLDYLLYAWIPQANSSTTVDLISGLLGNKTVEANFELVQLARLLVEFKKEKSNISQLMDMPEFKTQFQQFLDRHGHRSRNLDPYYATWRDNSDFIKRMIYDMSSEPMRSIEFEDNQNLLVKRRLRAESLIFAELEKRQGLLSFSYKKVLILVLNMAQAFALLRENQRYFWHLTLAKKRRIIMEVGNRLVEQHVLSAPEQFFFVTRDEFLNFLSSDADLSSLQKRANGRYQKWNQSLKTTRFDKADQKIQKGGVSSLHGLGVSAGIIQARAAIVRSLEEAQKMKPGSILVTSSVDPAWTPVFSRAAGLVLEVGGILSHAAIIAREFRLPAVTGVTRATSLISDNQLLKIDGLKGTVTIIQES